MSLGLPADEDFQLLQRDPPVSIEIGGTFPGLDDLVEEDAVAEDRVFEAPLLAVATEQCGEALGQRVLGDPLGRLQRDTEPSRVVGLGVVAAGVDQEQLASGLRLLDLVLDGLEVDERRRVLEVGVRREEVAVALGPDLDPVPGQRHDQGILRLERREQQVEFSQDPLGERLEAWVRLAVVHHHDILDRDSAVPQDTAERDHVVGGEPERLELVLVLVFGDPDEEGVRITMGRRGGPERGDRAEHRPERATASRS